MDTKDNDNARLIEDKIQEARFSTALLENCHTKLVNNIKKIIFSFYVKTTSFKL